MWSLAKEIWPAPNDIKLALRDILLGILNWRVWSVMAAQEIRARYRRSVIGPLWLTLSMAVTVACIGFIWPILFKFDHRAYVPYLSVSLVTWAFISGVINEGAAAFTGYSSFIMQHRQPFFTFVMLITYRNLIIFIHMIIVFVGVSVIYLIKPQLSIFILLISFPIVSLSIMWMALLLGLLSVRFRDLPQIIASLMTVMFFLTPIIYMKSQLGESAHIIELNPFTHMLDLIRDPFFGQVPKLKTWIWTLSFAGIGWIITLIFYGRFRRRITYWL